MKGRNPMFLTVALVSAVAIGLGLAAKADIFEFTWWLWALVIAAVFSVAGLYDYLRRRRGQHDEQQPPL